MTYRALYIDPFYNRDATHLLVCQVTTTGLHEVREISMLFLIVLLRIAESRLSRPPSSKLYDFFPPRDARWRVACVMRLVRLAVRRINQVATPRLCSSRQMTARPGHLPGDPERAAWDRVSSYHLSSLASEPGNNNIASRKRRCCVGVAQASLE